MTTRTLLLLVGIPLLLLRAGEQYPSGTRSHAMGRSFMAAGGAWAVAANTARLAYYSQQSFSILYSPGLFQLHELRSAALAGTIPISTGVAGASIEHFGFDLYNETSIHTGIGFPLSENFAVGVSAAVYSLTIAGYGSTQQGTMNIGIIGKPFQQLELGCCWKNVACSRIGRTNERLPQILNLGLEYGPAEDFRFVMSLEKDVRYPLSLRAGLEKSFMDVFLLRCGTGDNPSTFTAGFSIRISSCEIGYGASSHSELGWTHQFEIHYNLGK
ncbi:MAG: hypothetical protein V1799_19365 [bacterium]